MITTENTEGHGRGEEKKKKLRFFAKFVDGLFGAGLLTPPKRLTEGLLFYFQRE